jgi:glutamine cyclotransferase
LSRLLLFLFCLFYYPTSLSNSALGDPNSKSLTTLPLLTPQVIKSEAYNASWFTQGLYQDKEVLYISSGLYGKSQLVYQSPKLMKRLRLPRRYFAEGLTIIDDKLYLLTWKENTLFVYDKTSLSKENTFKYEGQGWGLTDNNKELIMSNGSNELIFRNPKDFSIINKLTVKNLDKLNELEYVQGVIWANRWYDDHIYAINSDNGCVLGKMDLQRLRQQATSSLDEKNITNGIAYDEEQQGLWLTGKYWSKRFLVKLPSVDKNACH